MKFRIAATILLIAPSCPDYAWSCIHSHIVHHPPTITVDAKGNVHVQDNDQTVCDAYMRVDGDQITIAHDERTTVRTVPRNPETFNEYETRR